MIGLLRREIGEYIKNQNNRRLQKKLGQELYGSKNKIEVLSGPFRGMVYPDFVSTGSVLWSKLLGTYERELQGIIEEFLDVQWNYIIDIGCAEGYYAVGFALKGNCNEIFAYDIDKRAQHLIRNMCLKNSVSVSVGGLCDQELLNAFHFSDNEKPSLVICDCEGYERELFGNINSTNFSNVDLLIEIHDWCQYEDQTLNVIIEQFKDTHRYDIIRGFDDYDKAYSYSVKQLEGWPIKDRFEILKEGRRRQGCWLVLRHIETRG
ncbi:MAG: class I SAM-dependent methyltransferase [Lachnospiraceae bacterium]|nr:class I SAM-dependent methyltransferase [Lachnospiraceae bacterium]